jgi:hypothetical protein
VRKSPNLERTPTVPARVNNKLIYVNAGREFPGRERISPPLTDR